MAGLESAGLTIGNRGKNGAPGWIRTSTMPLLRRLPLPLDYGRFSLKAAQRKRELARFCAGMVGSVGFEPTLDAF